jgi:hypothetical protein
MKKLPQFSAFRNELSRWDEAAEKIDIRNKIKAMLGDNDFVFFFKKDKNYFGAPEEGRLVFARMKHPEPDDKGWVKDANFGALNLNKALEGEKTESLFGEKDLDKIEVMDQEKVYTQLAKMAKDADKIKTVLSNDENPAPEAPENQPGQQQLKDKR